ncbi:CorA metal ion transporter [Rhizina undulata]
MTSCVNTGNRQRNLNAVNFEVVISESRVNACPLAPPTIKQAPKNPKTLGRFYPQASRPHLRAACLLFPARNLLPTDNRLCFMPALLAQRGPGTAEARPGELVHIVADRDMSIESSALLDHREQQSMRPRRASMLGDGASSFVSRAGHHRPLSGNAPAMSSGIPSTSSNLRARDRSSRSGDSDSEEYLESAPLISGAAHDRSSLHPGKGRTSRPSTSDSGSSRRNQPQVPVVRDYGSVYFPASVPSSPRMDPRPPLLGLSNTPVGHYGGEDLDISRGYPDSSPTINDGFPDEEAATLHGRTMRRRRRVRQWPNLSVLEECSREEKEERSEGIETKEMSEPVYVGGRLRSGVRTAWHREEDEPPYRLTYFNDEPPATIHSHTISELLQPGQTFKDLIKPEPRVQ